MNLFLGPSTGMILGGYICAHLFYGRHYFEVEISNKPSYDYHGVVVRGAAQKFSTTATIKVSVPICVQKILQPFA
jgi:hypothetical protein